jgi:hypothetical protein
MKQLQDEYIKTGDNKLFERIKQGPGYNISTEINYCTRCDKKESTQHRYSEKY